MKRLLCTVMLVLMTLMLAGCGKATPSDAVSDALDELKTAEVGDLLALDNMELSEDTTEAYRDFLTKVSGFDYEITGETVAEDEQSAVVDVTITTYAFGDAFLDAYEELYQTYDASEINTDVIYKAVFDKLNSLEDKSSSYSIKIECEKKDDKWVAKLDDNGKFNNAILGDMVYVLKELAE